MDCSHGVCETQSRAGFLVCTGSVTLTVSCGLWRATRISRPSFREAVLLVYMALTAWILAILILTLVQGANPLRILEWAGHGSVSLVLEALPILLCATVISLCTGSLFCRQRKSAWLLQVLGLCIVNVDYIRRISFQSCHQRAPCAAAFGCYILILVVLCYLCVESDGKEYLAQDLAWIFSRLGLSNVAASRYRDMKSV